MGDKPTVAILGGGMAGLSAAWRLSEPAYRDRFGAITVYQRGWRLGGKGASSRGVNGRIEEHGLHVWLGHYDNAFRLMRDCYETLDRAHADPVPPIVTWRDAFVPAPDVGIFDHFDGVWRPWVAHLAANDGLPGDNPTAPDDSPRETLRRAGRLLQELVESLGETELVPVLSTVPDTTPRRRPAAAGAVLAAGAMVEALAFAAGPAAARAGDEAVIALDLAMAEVHEALGAMTADVWGARQAWHMVELVTAIVRGSVADGLMDSPSNARALNDIEFLEWIRGHGASQATIDSTYVRGLYDLVFGHAGGDPERRGFGAGTGALLSIKTLLDYKGAFFWKMTAGMGDVVFAPLYEALRRRGVDFEFFHRVENLHVSEDTSMIDAITLGRQAQLADERDHYEPLVDIGGLPCFPARPLLEQLNADSAIVDEPLESAWCTWPDVETRVLRAGVDFDHVVFAIPPPMAAHVCTELVAARRAWRDLVTNVATVATESLQLWLRADEDTLGWPHSGTTMTGYVDGFDTWASMPQLVGAEQWPEGEEPRSIAYFCNTLDSDWPPLGDWAAHATAESQRVRATAERFCREDLKVLLPNFDAQALCGGSLDAQYWSANVDPSDRYVQSLPGTDKYRLRPDESGFENLVLAGDWTDCGLNAGCIEAAVISGLQAGNALLGRHRFHQVYAQWLF